MRVIYSGFDGLDVAFQGCLPAAVVAALLEAKERAREERSPVLVDVGPGKVPMHVAETGSAGGFAIRTDTGEQGAIWMFKKSADPQEWNIFASVRSQALAVHGLEGVKAALYDVLQGIGATVIGESINRVDFAVDFLAPGFKLDPDRFIKHWACRVSEHCSDPAPEEGADGFHVEWGSRGVTSVTIGSMPGRQLIVYNKRREIAVRRKSWWWKIWGLDREDPATHDIWRVEIRAGKRHLKDHWRISTWADLEAMICDVYKAALQRVRYLAAGQSDSNVTRQEVDPLWQATAEIVGDALAEHESGVVPSDIREGRRVEIVGMYEGLICGLAASYAAARGTPDACVPDVADDMAAAVR